MPTTKFFNKYHLICERPDLKINKKYRSVKEIINDLRESELSITSRTTVYNIINNIGKNWKYYNVTIIKIREPLPYKESVISKRKVIRELIIKD